MNYKAEEGEDEDFSPRTPGKRKAGRVSHRGTGGAEHTEDGGRSFAAYHTNAAKGITGKDLSPSPPVLTRKFDNSDFLYYFVYIRDARE